jgi:hypothetical protein
MRGVGVDSVGRRITSFANVTNFFCTPITTRRGWGGIGFEDARGGGIKLVKDGGGKIRLAEDEGGGGIGVEDGWRGGIRAEDGGGKGHEDGMVQMTLPLGTCEDTRGITWVCFIPLGFSIEAFNLAPYTMQKLLNCY